MKKTFNFEGFHIYFNNEEICLYNIIVTTLTNIPLIKLNGSTHKITILNKLSTAGLITAAIAIIVEAGKLKIVI